MSEIFEKAEEAWNYLVAYGGLEVGDRDALLVEQLTERLTSVIRPDDDGSGANARTER